MNLNDPITEEWLKSVGFRWDEWERSGGKHWTLWFGDIANEGFSSFEDLGLELAPPIVNRIGEANSSWFCWLRSDFSHKYGRFIHLRHVREIGDVIQIIVALIGQDWKPQNHLYGAIRTEKAAQYLRESESRLDRQIMKSSKWDEHEKDESQMRPRKGED